jgi:hypothetical protein
VELDRARQAALGDQQAGRRKALVAAGRGWRGARVAPRAGRVGGGGRRFGRSAGRRRRGGGLRRRRRHGGGARRWRGSGDGGPSRRAKGQAPGLQVGGRAGVAPGCDGGRTDRGAGGARRAAPRGRRAPTTPSRLGVVGAHGGGRGAARRPWRARGRPRHGAAAAARKAPPRRARWARVRRRPHHAAKPQLRAPRGASQKGGQTAYDRGVGRCAQHDCPAGGRGLASTRPVGVYVGERTRKGLGLRRATLLAQQRRPSVARQRKVGSPRPGRAARPPPRVLPPAAAAGCRSAATLQALPRGAAVGCS